MVSIGHAEPERDTPSRQAFAVGITKSFQSGLSKLKDAPDALVNASKMLKRTLSVDTVISPTVDYEMAKFTQFTSFHGVMRWYNCTNWRSRIFWMLVVFGAIIAFVIEVNSLVKDLLAQPTVTEVNFIYDSGGLEFPTITICNLAVVQKSKVDKLNMSEDALKYVLAAYLELESLYSYYNQSALEDLRRAYMNFTSNFTDSNNQPFDIESFFMDNGFACEDMVKKCWFGGHEIEDCCSHATANLTTKGLCYQFSNLSRSTSVDRQFISGSAYGAKFLINAMADEYCDSIVQPFHEIGVVFYIHDHRERPYISTGGYAVSPGHKVYAGVTFKHYTLLPEEKWGKCQNDWSNPTNPSIHQYTYANCQADCIAKQFELKCNCTPIKYRTHSGAKLCEPMELYKCYHQTETKNVTNKAWYTDSPCDCQTECDRREYQAQISYASILPTKQSVKLLKEINVNDDFAKNFLMMDVYLQATSYTQYTQQQGGSLVTTLSNIGGCMGMFIGASLITVVEVVVFLSKLLWTSLSRQRKTRVIVKIESSDNLQDMAKRHRLNSRCSSVDLDFYTQDEPRKSDRPVSQTSTQSDSSRDSGQFSCRDSQNSTPERKEGMSFYLPETVSDSYI